MHDICSHAACPAADCDEQNRQSLLKDPCVLIYPIDTMTSASPTKGACEPDYDANYKQ